MIDKGVSFMKNVLYVLCEPSEEEFVQIFNMLENYIVNNNFQNVDSNINCKFYNIESNLNTHQIINNIKKDKYYPVNNVPISENTSIAIDILIPDDDGKIDMFFYRYLFILKNQLLREQDFFIFTCNNTYYNKLTSFILLENMFDNHIFSYDISEGKAKRFPTQFSVSSEWFPAMSFDKNETNGLYDALSLPLYKSQEHFETILTEYNLGQANLNTVFQTSKEDKTKIIKTFFHACILYWLQDTDENVIQFISEQSSSVSTLTILILAIQLKYISKRKKFKFDTEDIENLVNICCDFSEGILQIIENIICHSSGGCFLFRLNDNLDKIDAQYEYNKHVLDIESYIRISLVDYSKKGISDSIKEKSKIHSSISLEEVFNFEEFHNSEYEKYLLNDDSTVHHYGLPIFKSIVLQYSGCFTVKSSGKSFLVLDDDISTNYNDTGLKPINLKLQKENHIPGTEYDIILPLTKTIYTKKRNQGITSLSFDTNSFSIIHDAPIIFKEEIYNFFSTNVNTIIKELSCTINNMQELKEKTINTAAIQLCSLIKTFYKENAAFYFFVNNETLQYRRTEIIAKIILKTFSLMDKYDQPLNFVIFGFSDQRIYSFVRQFALFYRKGKCKYMKHNQLFVVSDSYKTEILLYGQNLNTSYNYLCSQRFNYGIPSNIVTLLKHVIQKTELSIANENNELAQPIDFNNMQRMELINKTPILSNKKWFFNKLYTVINNDIHDMYLGCKISHTHVRVNNIHIDSFYECQLLFGNSFWCDIFANSIVDYILSNNSLDKSTPIVLYGYETYSEPLLLLTKQKLLSKVDMQVEYLIFENSKYITANEKSTEKIRYFDSVNSKLGNKIECSNFVFISGISTTLSSFKNQLYKQLCSELKIRELKSDRNMAFVVVQVDDKSYENKVSKDYIEIDDTYVYSKKGYLEFINEERCGYLISINSKWYTPENCSLCMPPNPKEERFLVETNETSTVPMMLIKPNNDDSFNYHIHANCGLSNSFLDNINNKKYLYYCHLNRNGNHYQYYIRTAHFVQENLYEGSELCQWLDKIRKKEEKDFSNNTINIIICPGHFSNETFVSAVNQYVFNNRAHIISLNIKKEFRDSFETKFSNYKTMLDLIKKEMPEIKFNINFYYVDDHIVSGSTFNRAKSLVTGMISKYLYSDKTNQFHINIFKAMIILLNRNSAKSISNYFNNISNIHKDTEEFTLPFYSFINLKTPSIRSYGDSCPICQKVEQLKIVVTESSLYSTEKYWRKKLFDYEIKNLQQAKDQKDMIDCKYQSYDARGFRRLQCSEAIWNSLIHTYETITTAKQDLENCILKYLKSVKSNEEKIEYLISFIKVMCRPHIIYQENINSAILQIILELYFLYFEESGDKKADLYKYINTILEKSSNILRYDLYRILVSCMCSLGSNLFYRDDDKLLCCYKKGIELESKITENIYQITFDDFLRFQIKINMFSNKDSAVKAEKISSILSRKIEEIYK